VCIRNRYTPSTPNIILQFFIHFFLSNLVPGFEVFYKGSTGNLFCIWGEEFEEYFCFRLVDNKEREVVFRDKFE
jgi:hypothetical protein